MRSEQDCVPGQEPGQPLALRCDVGAFDAQQRRRYAAIRDEIGRAVQEVRELPDGYAFRFPPATETIELLAEFIALERLCCPFFRFVVEVEPEGGPIWLRLTGGEGAREILAAEMAADR